MRSRRLRQPQIRYCVLSNRSLSQCTFVHSTVVLSEGRSQRLLAAAFFGLRVGCEGEVILGARRPPSNLPNASVAVFFR